MSKEAQKFIGNNARIEVQEHTPRERVMGLLQAIIGNNIDNKLTHELATGILQVFDTESAPIWGTTEPEKQEHPKGDNNEQ
jgi:hypothetical protein